MKIALKELFVEHFVSENLQELVIQSVNEFDSSSIVDLIPKLPLWVMNPDYERVSCLN